MRMSATVVIISGVLGNGRHSVQENHWQVSTGLVMLVYDGHTDQSAHLYGGLHNIRLCMHLQRMQIHPVVCDRAPAHG